MSEILIFLTVVVNAALGFIIFFRNRKARENLFYAFFVIFLDFWILANFLENEPGIVGLERLESFLRLDFAFGALFMYSWLKFCMVMAAQSGHLRRLNAWGGWIGGAIALGFVPLTLITPLVINSVEFYDDVIHFGTGPLWLLYAAFILLCMVGGPLVLWKTRRFVRRAGDDRLARNINLILAGFLLSLGNAVVINLLQPILDISLELSRIGIYGLVILVAFTAYAIVRHQFLNVKLIAVETFAVALVILSAMQLPDKQIAYGMALRVSILLGTLLASIFIVRGVRQEIRQREELEVLTKKLTKANRDLEELSRFKSHLLSIASHQIKSPLAIIKGYLTIVLDGMYGPVQGNIRSALEKSKKAVDGLTALIEELLDLRRAEEGKLNYQFERVDLGKMLGGVADNFSLLAAQKRISLTRRLPAAPVFVEADPEKLHEVFQNLLDNALKYTPQGFIEIELTTADGKARVGIRDSGIGMPAELLPKLFGEFVRDERIQKKIKGTGFGLHVAKKIAVAHGGRIWAESPGEGQGSAFFVELPLASYGHGHARGARQDLRRNIRAARARK